MRRLIAIGLLIPSLAFAKGSEERTLESVDAKCMQRALEDRENSLIVVSNTYNDSLARALKKRKEDVIDGWGLSNPDQRSSGLRTAWSTYEKTASKARQKRAQGVRNTWNQFDNRRVFCGQKGVSSGEPGTVQNDLTW